MVGIRAFRCRPGRVVQAAERCIKRVTVSRLYVQRRRGSRAPMSQKMGKKNPMRNMTQCPFRIDRRPRVIKRTT
jgi:hypothetical protein